MNILIIEDEINAYEYLEILLSQLRPSYQLVGHLDSVEDSINWLENNEPPDLILLDIQLSDGISFEIFNHIAVNAPIIFTTAYDQYALQAFKLNSIDYLLKPIEKEALEFALQKWEQRAPNYIANSAQFNTIVGSLIQEKKNRCLIKKGSHFEFINVDQIAFVHSEDSLTFLYTRDGKRHLYTKTVAGLSQELDPKTFFQINRKQLININAIQKIHPFLNQRLKIELNPTVHGLDLVVARNRMMEFKSWVDS